MRKLKIFIYIGDDLGEENLEISDLIEHLNLILEKQDIHIYLAKSQYFSEIGCEKTRNEEIDTNLDESAISLVIFGKDFEGIEIEDINKLYERVRKTATNPQKLYVYFRKDENISERLKQFHDSFPQRYGHFTGSFSTPDSLKNDFMLQFQLFQSENLQDICNIEIKDSRVLLNGNDLLIDLHKVPFIGKNEDYLHLVSNIKKTEKLLKVLSKDEPEYEEYLNELSALQNKKEKVEKGLWDTALQITRLSNEQSSERLNKAITLFNEGDNKGANAILDEVEIYKEAEKNLDLFKLGKEGKKGLEINFKELKLKIQTLENEMSEGWIGKVFDILSKIEVYSRELYGEKSELYINTLIESGNKRIELGSPYNSPLFKAMEICERYFQDNYGLIAKIWMAIGDYRNINSDNSEAIKAYYMAWNNMQQKMLNENKIWRFTYKLPLVIRRRFLNRLPLKSPDVLLYLQRLGKASFIDKEYKEYLWFEKLATKIAEKYFDPLHPQRLECYRELGCAFLHTGDFKKAEEYLDKAMHLQKELKGPDHPSMASILKNKELLHQMTTSPR